MNRKELLEQLKKDITDTENKIEYRNLYNLRNFVVNGLIKAGIVIDYALPFILSSIILFNIRHLEGNTPFIIDEVEEYAKVRTTYTSTGVEKRNVSYLYDYDRASIQYSTGWVLDEFNMYKRVITTYKINNIDLNDTKKILSMSKKEIEKVLEIDDVRTISKKNLTAEDKLYNEDMIIIKTITDHQYEKRLQTETDNDNYVATLIYLSQSLIYGFGGKVIQTIIFKSYVYDKLRGLQPQFKVLTKKDVKNLEKILDLKRENLQLLDEKYSQNNETEKVYKLKII